MREILFRGKRVDGGEWVTGYYANVCGLGCNINETRHYILEYPKGQQYEIYTGTLGQYTGLTDKNSRKIFEGDIVTVVYEASDFRPLSYGDRGVCVYNTDPTPRRYIGFYINWGDKAYIKRADIGYWYKKIIVIGNIHDNPELLKEATE